MSTEVSKVEFSMAEIAEKVIVGGDLSRLTPAERLSYYHKVCESVGLNWATRPFEYLVLNNRMVLYARKDCTDQLRDLHGISIQIVGRELVDGVYVVTARAENMTERKDESIGAVPLPASPTDKANAMMKAETKAKRRVTLSICGLGMLDETELDTVPQAVPVAGESHAGMPQATKTPLKVKLEGKVAQLKEGATLASQARPKSAEPKAVDTIPTEDPVGADAPSTFLSTCPSISRIDIEEVIDLTDEPKEDLSLYEKIVGEMQAQTTVKDLMAVMNDMRKVAAKLTQQERAVILQLKDECLRAINQ